MSRAFAKAFYNSKEWKRARDYCMIRDHHACIHCGKPAEEVHHVEPLTPGNIYDVTISLNPDNLISLCRDCHFDVHKKYRSICAKNAIKKKMQNRIIREDGTYFDDEGMLVKRKVYIVYGSPRSGKTSYVMNNKMFGDVVIDIDSIITALQYSDERIPYNTMRFLAMDVRDFLINELVNNSKHFDCRNVWIIGGFPNKKDREELAERLNAELIYISIEYKKAEARAVNDNLYGDVQYSKDVINEWWRNFQP